jgi:hypothetical protein
MRLPGCARQRVTQGILLAGIIVFGLLFVRPAHAGPGHNVTGWIWSANVGWISLNALNCQTENRSFDPDPCTLGGFDYGVNVGDTGEMSGFAWSATVGWICMGSSCSGSSGRAPDGGWQARVVPSSGEVLGWASVVALGDGGRISFSCRNEASCPIVSFRTSVDMRTGRFRGWAWNGASVGGEQIVSSLGWISWESTLGRAQTTWKPDPLCAVTGGQCTTDTDCPLLGELCCIAGEPCGQCGVSSSVCGAQQECGRGDLCCRPGATSCGQCVGNQQFCRADSQCVGEGGVCCPLGAICSSDEPPPERCEEDPVDPDAEPKLYPLGFCVNSTTLCIDSGQCGGVAGACDRREGLCVNTDQTCAASAECSGETNCCAHNIGLCDRNDDEDQTVPCISNEHCASALGSGVQCIKKIGKCSEGLNRLCVVAENCTTSEAVCEDVQAPWLQTEYGQVFSGGRLGSASSSPPPIGLFNATYCVLADGRIENFYSKGACGDFATSPYTPEAFSSPLRAASYLDVEGILKGRYGSVQSWPEGIAHIAGSQRPRGKIFLVDGRDLHVTGTTTFENGAGDASGAGLFIVRGGDLFIEHDVQYSETSVTKLDQLASPGWLILKDDLGRGGNVVIQPDVKNIVGAFYAEGAIRTGTTGNAKTERSLTVRGMMIAREFHFERAYAGRTAAELITSDGRAVANPPPGFADVASSAPRVQLFAPQ